MYLRIAVVKPQHFELVCELTKHQGKDVCRNSNTFNFEQIVGSNIQKELFFLM